MNRKMMLLLTSILFVALLASACSTSDKGGKNSKNADGKAIITLNIGEDDYGARMKNYEAAFIALNEELAANGEDVEVVANIMAKVGDDELVLQAQAGQYRDIFMNSSIDIGWQLDAGLIQEMDWVRDSEAYQSLDENLWDIMTYKGHIYGAIQDIDASPLYINKDALKQLGWSEGDIEQLPERVKNGDFILDDVLNIAAEAVSKGITQYGLGCDGLDNICIQVLNNQAMGFEPYDLEESKTIIDQEGMLKTYSFWKKGLDNGAISKDYSGYEDVGFDYYVNGQFMFFIGGTGTYKNFRVASGQEEPDFTDWFYEHHLVTLVPAGEKGGEPGSLSNPRLYYVGAKVDEEKMPYVKRIIELSMKPNQQIDHTLATGKLPVTKNAREDERLSDNRFIQEVTYMLEYTNVRPPHLGYPDYRDLYKKGIELLMTKKGTAEEAYEFFISNYKQVGLDENELIYR